MKLPPLNDKSVKDEKEAEYSLKPPDIDLLHVDENKEKFKEYFKELIENEGMEELSEEGQDEHDKLEKSYKSLIGLFDEKEDSDDLLKKYEIEIKKMDLYNLEDIGEAIETGKLDISKYDTFTMSRLLMKLEKIEPPKSLDNFNIKTIEDFYTHVTSGKIDVSKYEEEELDKFIDDLMK